jgi:hypothetical protein
VFDDSIGHQASELASERGFLEALSRSTRRLRVGPHREDEPPAVVVAPEGSSHESALLVRELDLHQLVDRPEGGLVDAGGQPKCQYLEHAVDATVR